MHPVCSRPIVARFCKSALCVSLSLALWLLAWSANGAATKDAPAPCRISVVDKSNGWPVPMIQLRTLHGVQFVTDNAGLIAFDLPELMNVDTWFTVSGHGYEVPADGFGFRGLRLHPLPGASLRIEVTRTIRAMRLGRLTGAGLFAESQKMGLPAPAEESGELGRDSIQTAMYKGSIFYAWGDTLLARYPLGLFQMTGATSPMLPLKSFAPPLIPPYRHFASNGVPVNIADIPGAGPSWLGGFAAVNDRQGTTHLLAAYSKIKPPLQAYERGICEWDPSSRLFKKLRVTWAQTNGAPEKPLVPEGHPVSWTEQGTNWLLFGNPFPFLKCEATYEAYTDPARWIALTPQTGLVDKSGAVLKPHSGSIAWNALRKKWITVFTQAYGKPSVFGEVYFAEAQSPFGPWVNPVKILSHDNYTFYNPRIDHELTPEDAPFILFEGTFTADFADKPEPWPRYNYNQILYRLDL